MEILQMKFFKVSNDTWHVTFDMHDVTCSGVNIFSKNLSCYLLRFGRNSVLKIISQRMTDSVTNFIN